MAAYTLVALVLAVAGTAVFSVLLHRGVTASLDATLATRAAPLVDTLGTGKATSLPTSPANLPFTPADQSGQGVQSGPGPQDGATTVDSFAAVYRPDGVLAQLQPADPGYQPLTAAQVAGATSDPRHFTLRNGDQSLRVLAVPVARADGTWVVAVAISLNDASEAANKAIRDLEFTVPVLIVLAALGAWLLSGAALRPVERMRADAEQLGAHDPADRITVPATADELAKLARTFNALLDRLQRSLTRQRNLIADAGHELRTPLAVLRTELDLADTPGRNRDDLADSVDHARREVERLSNLAEDLLFLAQADLAAPIVQLEPTDISVVLSETTRANRAPTERRGITLDLVAPEHLVVQADAEALRRALDNLVANALAATNPGGRITLAATSESRGAVITVSDTGNGFPPEFLDHAFGRFTRPDAARSPHSGGAGLGLAIVAEIVHAHHGTFAAANNPDGGAVITIVLPVAAASLG